MSVELFVNHGNDKINNLDALWEISHRLLATEDKSLKFDYDAHADIPTYSLYDAIRDVLMNIQDEDDFNIKFIPITLTGNIENTKIGNFGGSLSFKKEIND